MSFSSRHANVNVTVKMKEFKILQKKLMMASVKSAKAGLVGAQAAAGHHDAPGMTVAEIGLIQEFGAPSRNIPERSFIRAAFRSNTTVKRHMEAVAKEMIKGLSVEQAYEVLGAWAAGEIRKRIDTGKFKRLSPFTVARKGHSAPLIDSQQMYEAIGHEVS